MFVNSILRIEKVLSKESYRGVEATMCCSLNCCQHFPWQMTGLLRHEFWNKLFEKSTAHTLDILRGLHRKRNCNRAKFVTLQERSVCKTAYYKIMGISRSTYMSYKWENKKRCRILPH